MSEAAASTVAPRQMASIAAACVAIDPPRLGGAIVKGLSGPPRDHWLAELRALLPLDVALRRIPLHIGDGRLLGGLDLSATLKSGRPVAEQGCLVEADGGIITLVSAERMAAETVSRITAVMDQGEVVLERDGLTSRTPARFGVIALDEGLADDEFTPLAIDDRLAFRIDLNSWGRTTGPADMFSPADIAAARKRLAGVQCNDAGINALCQTAMALGIASFRACIFAVETARILAALGGRTLTTESDVRMAAQLVLAHRATQLPASETPPEEETAEPERDEEKAENHQTDDAVTANAGDLTDVVLEAAKAAIPPGLIAALLGGPKPRQGRQSSGKSGIAKKSLRTGRPAAARRGKPERGAHLDLVETLRAAAPWQRLRVARPGLNGNAVVQVRVEDFHVRVRKDRQITTTIFVVDASGSSALHRLAEVKGAVELLLKDCYVRRDQVALIAFRGRTAELILPPTRSLVRARRCLAALPGGGGTPLAAALDAAGTLAHAIRQKGQTPSIVLMTDGRANVARDNTTGRDNAEADAIAAARSLRELGVAIVAIDTSPQPQSQGQRIAAEMRARYLALPHADAASLSNAVKMSATI
jgi:magnesium chelatase subunit D